MLRSAEGTAQGAERSRKPWWVNAQGFDSFTFLSVVLTWCRGVHRRLISGRTRFNSWGQDHGEIAQMARAPDS